jgi:hypothetical protein
MKKLVTLLFLILIVNLGFGQVVNAPDPKSFIVNTASQDASGFELTGFSSTATLLASVSLVNPPNGTTFYLNTTTGLTAASGFILSGNKTKLVITGTMASINTALASLKINTGTITGDINISVAATINPDGFYYNGTNGHFYKPITLQADRTSYTNARSRSLLTTFKGQTGYLVTITSADEDAFIFANVPAINVWFAATDETTDGTWVIDAGPEKGTVMKTQNGQTAGNITGVYNNWAWGEPNGNNGTENYAVAKWNGAVTWNDLSNNWNNPYVIEYGTWSNPDDATFTEFYSNSVAHSNGQTIKALFGFKFNNSIDKTKFSAQIFKRNNNTSTWTASDGYKSLSGLGKVYLSNQIDTAQIFTNAAISINALSDMTSFTTADIGKIYKMTITGATGGAIWGTDIYTSDTYIPTAAVHAGVIVNGQTKEVYIKVVEGQSNYEGTTRNGVSTSGYGGWDLSYQFVSEPSSYKAVTSPGQVEWCVIYDYDATNKRYRVGVDAREFVGTGVTPNNVTKLKLLDLWDGIVTFNSYDPNGWAEYWINTPTQFNYAGSSYSSNLRNGNGFYGVSVEFAFTQIGAYKQHKMQLNEYNSDQLKTLYNSIVTVSDVWLAFKEVSNTGIFGNEAGKEFGYGIQYKNADVNEDGYFNEADCFALLQNLTGVKELITTYTLDNTIRLIPDSIYNSIGKSTWSSFQSFAGKEYPFSLLDNVISYNYDLAVSWKGDVNLSHSATPPANGITTMSVRTTMSTPISTDVQSSIMTELANGKVYAYITFDPLQQNVVGTQFQLNYDNSFLKFEGVEFKTKGSPMNYGTNKETFINLGSLITDGSTSLDNTTEYKVIFTPTKAITNTLGLLGIGSTDAVNKDGKQLKLKVN